jgi:hypothetical protein
MKPGSWPDPPPVITPTLPATGAPLATTTRGFSSQPDDVGMRLDEALDGILDDLVRIVDKPLHNSP